MGGAGSDWQINTELIVGSWWRRSDRSFVNGVCFVWFPYHLTHALTTRTLYVSRVWAGTEPVGWFLDRCGAGEAPEVAAAVPAGSISSPCKSRCIFASNPLFPYAAALLVKLTNLGSGLRRATCLSCLSPQRFLGRSLENKKTTKKNIEKPPLWALEPHPEQAGGCGARCRSGARRRDAARGTRRVGNPLGSGKFTPAAPRHLDLPLDRAWRQRARSPGEGPSVGVNSGIRNTRPFPSPIISSPPRPAPRAQVPEPAAFTATKREVELSVWL